MRPRAAAAQARVIGVDHVDEAVIARFAEQRRLTPVKLMWSVITMTLPGGISGRRLPAALVSNRVSQPSAASVRIGTFIASARPCS